LNVPSLSVSQLNEYVRRSLAGDPMLRGICLTGEISNLKRHVSGHWYFSLKDEEASIACAMFRQAAMSVRFYPENGMRVRLFGNVGLYSKTGTYQFYADAMEQDGLGELYLRFEALKNRLMSEGLFDASLKKPLPVHVRGVGIVTSKTGAVVHDIARVAWRRDPSVQLYLCPASVQGSNAADEIVAAIKLLDHYSPAEVIIVGRGGGSMEDLWPFNEEKVARAIAACRKPVVSAVGHETDFTIADFVADLRAPTPSAAAELVVERRDALSNALVTARQRMTNCLKQRFSQLEMELVRAKQSLHQLSPQQRTERLLGELVGLRSRMQSAVAGSLSVKQYALQNAAPALDYVVSARLNALEHRLSQAATRLRTAGPIETIKRGYAVVMHDGKAVRSVDELQAGDELALKMSNGTVTATVNRVKRGI